MPQDVSGARVNVEQVTSVPNLKLADENASLEGCRKPGAFEHDVITRTVLGDFRHNRVYVVANFGIRSWGIDGDPCDVDERSTKKLSRPSDLIEHLVHILRGWPAPDAVSDTRSNQNTIGHLDDIALSRRTHDESLHQRKRNVEPRS